MNKIKKLPSEYERLAIKQIHAWKHPESTFIKKMFKSMNLAIDKTGNIVMTTPVVGDVLTKSVQGLLAICNDISQATLPEKTIYNEFQKISGKTIVTRNDLFEYDLETIDNAIGLLSEKYKGISAVEGAGLGFIGLPGIPADIVALISLNLRAIGEYCIYCGFNAKSQHEKLFMMNILALSSSSSDISKVAVMSQLVKITKDIALKKTWKDLEKHAFVKIIKEITKALGTRLTKAKLAQFIPAAGAVIGGGFNYHYTSRVTSAAYYLYRERFLIQKYGEEIINIVSMPDSEYQPVYA